MDTNQLLINFLLFFFLPLWGIAGFIDWCCHRATKIEACSGWRESLMHAVMGIQIGIPIVICLLFKINVLVILICILAWLLHEAIAHWDVRYASPRRHISIWEMHAHSYMATLPLYLLVIILVMNWPTFIRVISLDWAGEWQLIRVDKAYVGGKYLLNYLVFMLIACVLPYTEELLRCIRYSITARR